MVIYGRSDRNGSINLTNFTSAKRSRGAAFLTNENSVVPEFLRSEVVPGRVTSREFSECQTTDSRAVNFCNVPPLSLS